MTVRHLRRAALLTLIAIAAAPAAAAGQADYRPQDEPPFGGRPSPELSAPPIGVAPSGFELTAGQAAAIADRSDAVAGQREERRLRRRISTRGAGVWQISYLDAGGTERVRVFVDDDEAELIEAWTGTQVDVPLARGYDDAVGGPANDPLLFVPLALAFFLPFFDPRRPFRLLHLDLLALLGFSVSLAFFNAGKIEASVGLVYPLLGYLFARAVIAGFRGGESRERLLPVVGRRWLVAGIVVLCGVHGTVAITADKVVDVGLAGVIGADRLADGQDLYGEGTAEGISIRGDTYGPVNYIAYSPFEQVFPWSGEWDDLPAARYASLAFSLLTALALFALGRRLRPGEEGRTLGVALAYAWLAYPFTVWVLASGFNDALVPLGVAAALLVASRPLARGAVAALAGLTKFGPLALAPLLARGPGERGIRSVAIFAAGFLGAAAVAILPLLPDGGFRELYDRSLGYQASRGSPFSVWGQAPSLGWLQDVAKALAVLFGAALLFVPRRRDLPRLAALAAAVIIATEFASTHWLYPYTVWFAPLLLAALFAAHRGPEPPPGAPAPRRGSKNSRLT